MITEKDLQEAIAECQGVRNPNASTAIKLAAFLTIQREMYGAQDTPGYSYAAPYNNDMGVGSYGDSDFLQAIQGKDPAAMWTIMDELMDTLKMLNERVYKGVMRKIR